jgi:hypothetical protein
MEKTKTVLRLPEHMDGAGFYSRITKMYDLVEENHSLGKLEMDWDLDKFLCEDKTIELSDLNFTEKGDMTATKYVNPNLIEQYNKITDKFLVPTDEAEKNFEYLVDKYNINLEKTIFCYFRAQDLYCERPSPLVPPWAYIETIDKLIESEDVDTVLLQSDGILFYEHLTTHFKSKNIKFILLFDIDLPSYEVSWEKWHEKENHFGGCYESPQMHFDLDSKQTKLWFATHLIASRTKFFVSNISNFQVVTQLRRKNKNVVLINLNLEIEIISDSVESLNRKARWETFNSDRIIEL